MTKISPTHYRRGAIEVWDFIIDQELDYLEGNIVKYICRAGYKEGEDALDDVLKAKAYLNKLLSTKLFTTQYNVNATRKV